MKYAIVIEKAGQNFSACVAAADTLEEVQQLIREAVEFHLEGMREHASSRTKKTR